MPQLLPHRGRRRRRRVDELALEDLGHYIFPAVTGEAGLDYAVRNRGTIDLAIVDVMLPGIDGFEVCRRLSLADALPVVLTARSDPIDIVISIECGADDYVVKPVEPRVLDAQDLQGRAPTCRPVGDDSAPVTVVGDLAIDEGAMMVTHGGADLALTPTALPAAGGLPSRHAGQDLYGEILERYGGPATSGLAPRRRLRAAARRQGREHTANRRSSDRTWCRLPVVLP